MVSDKARILRPFLLSAGILIGDQVTKALIVDLVPRNKIAFRALGDFLWIVHARNTGVAFSMGDSLPPWMRTVLFSLLASGPDRGDPHLLFPLRRSHPHPELGPGLHRWRRFGQHRGPACPAGGRGRFRQRQVFRPSRHGTVADLQRGGFRGGGGRPACRRYKLLSPSTAIRPGRKRRE